MDRTSHRGRFQHVDFQKIIIVVVVVIIRHQDAAGSQSSGGRGTNGRARRQERVSRRRFVVRLRGWSTGREKRGWQLDFSLFGTRRNHGVPRRLMMMMMTTVLGSACSRWCYSRGFIVTLSLFHPSISTGLGWWWSDSSVRHEGGCFNLFGIMKLFCVNSEKLYWSFAYYTAYSG